jgi:protein involved in sex pheromone biosynthesis
MLLILSTCQLNHDDDDDDDDDGVEEDHHHHQQQQQQQVDDDIKVKGKNYNKVILDSPNYMTCPTHLHSLTS